MPSNRLAITLGDVAGIGPEVVARAWPEDGLAGGCPCVVVGDAGVLRRALALADRDLDVVELSACDDHLPRGDVIPCWNPSPGLDLSGVIEGTDQPHAGQAAAEAVTAAAQAALSGQVGALVTAPLSKAALHLAGVDFPGQTEILARLCGVREFAMMLHLSAEANAWSRRSLSVAHVTLHTSVRTVPGQLSEGGILDTIRLVDHFVRRIDAEPRPVGVCALNPHAGESGLFGDEEARFILPAVRRAQGAGLLVSGPWPADALFQRAARGEFSGIVAMYHDQGHIPIKLIGQGLAVNVTLGLPIVRTSPSHGTAFDIAWQGRADPRGMREAMRIATQLMQGGKGVRNLFSGAGLDTQ